MPDHWRQPLDQGLSGDEVIVGFRPEAAEVTDHGGLGATVYSDDLHGAYTMLHLAFDSGDTIVHLRSDRSAFYPIGAPVRFDLDPKMVRFFDPQSELAMTPEVHHG